MPRLGFKTAPTAYPHVPFHGLRTAQLLSSMVVASIMWYFIYQLQHDHWKIPWTFILLLVVSMLTILSLTATIILHLFYGLNPLLNLVLNSSLLLIWSVGFALLSWWSSGTLTHVCNTSNWENETGIMVCRIYKALFAFAMLGFVSTLLALFLDVYVFRQATRLGKYNQMQNLDLKTPGNAAFNRSTPALDLDGPIPAHSPYGFQPSRRQPQQMGYEMPEEQQHYDTGYQGGHHDSELR